MKPVGLIADVGSGGSCVEAGVVWGFGGLGLAEWLASDPPRGVFDAEDSTGALKLGRIPSILAMTAGTE